MRRFINKIQKIAIVNEKMTTLKMKSLSIQDSLSSSAKDESILESILAAYLKILPSVSLTPSRPSKSIFESSSVTQMLDS